MDKNKTIYVLGAGGHAKVVVSGLIDAGYRVKAVLDDDQGKQGQSVLGVRVTGPMDDILDAQDPAAVIAVGDNRAREKIAERYRAVEWTPVVHPRAFVHPSAKIGPGSVVFAGAVIQPDTVIGAHCIVNTSAGIDHDCRIKDFAHIAPGCHIAGGVRVGRGALLGIGSSVVPGTEIGAWAVIGAGSAVTGNVPEAAIVGGVPAKPILK